MTVNRVLDDKTLREIDFERRIYLIVIVTGITTAGYPHVLYISLIYQYQQQHLLLLFIQPCLIFVASYFVLEFHFFNFLPSYYFKILLHFSISTVATTPIPIPLINVRYCTILYHCLTHLLSIHCCVAISISHQSINQEGISWHCFYSSKRKRSTNNHKSLRVLLTTRYLFILYLSSSRSPSSLNITSARMTRGKQQH